METSAVIMMIVAMATVWGGLALAMVNLVRHPDESSGDVPDDADPHLDDHRYEAEDEEAIPAYAPAERF
ncbi:methionine/alanine import family NSS transporter small subunit [Micrococcus cohnii]|uniref:Methionine/alanine import family NSS transporter small subunit n=1 Tax=Micrococcus cohnii TaxID=993416 RepID=A0A7W7GPG0_9MICC|nr:methionine/alanine import family NSS transporter small subunit [uncultured Micrococcus sp.]MBB4735862.1 hypothetical protein [Micrococcus cohnii]